MSTAKFAESDHLRVIGEAFVQPGEEPVDGVVVEIRWQEEKYQWIYKLNHIAENDEGTWDNWYSEEDLEKVPGHL